MFGYFFRVADFVRIMKDCVYINEFSSSIKKNEAL